MSTLLYFSEPICRNKIEMYLIHYLSSSLLATNKQTLAERVLKGGMRSESVKAQILGGGGDRRWGLGKRRRPVKQSLGG